LGDRLVVVKIALRGGGEAETLGRLIHHNIVPVYSVREDPETQRTAICMPYLGRGTLLKALDAAYETDNEPLSARVFVESAREDALSSAIPEAYSRSDGVLMRASYQEGVVHIMAQLADALAHAHQAGILHRDLKPSNVLVAPSGCPLLLDFNLSSDARSQRGLVGGTLPYMAPEQLVNVLVDTAPVGQDDPRSDLFSLGVMLFESLTGQLPFGDHLPSEEADVAAFRIMARQEEGGTPLHSLNPHIDPQLAKIVARCLELEVEARFASAQELAQQLRAQLRPTARLQRWARRRRFLLQSGAAVVTVAAAGLGISLARRAPYAQRRYQAGVTAFREGDLPRAVVCFTDAMVDRPDAHEPLFARGQALAGLRRYADAAEDFHQAYELAPDGLIAAWAGYAYLMAGREIPARTYYPKALTEHGYETAAVLNNLGYAFRNVDDFKCDAVEYLTQAIQRDPRCFPAYLNRAYVYANYPLPCDPNGVAYGELAVRDAQFAATLETGKALAYFTLAMIYWKRNSQAEYDPLIMRNLRLALDHGYDREELLNRSGLEQRYTQPLRSYALHVTPVPPPPLVLTHPERLPRFESERS
jgi:tetratricopeptide (TPR) repeat protein